MAEGINPIRSYGSGGESTGSGTPANRNLQSGVNGFQDVGKESAANMDALTAKLEKAQKLSDAMAKSFVKQAEGLRHMLDTTDDLTTALKTWQQYTDKLGRTPGIFQNKTRVEMMAFLEDFMAQSKRLWNQRHFLHPQQLGQVEQALKKTDGMMSKLAKTTDSAFDSKAVEDFGREFAQIQQSAAKLNQTLQRLPVGKLTQGFRDIAKTVQGTHLEKFGMVSKFLDKIHNIRELRANLADLGKKRNTMGKNEFAQKKQSLRSQMARQGILVGEDGQIGAPKGVRFPKRAVTSGAYMDIANTLSESGGRSNALDKRLSAWTLKKVTQSGMEGGSGVVGAVPSFLLKMMEKGGGSVMGGMSSGLLGGVEGLASKAAWPLAIAQMVQSVYDKNALENRKVMTGVGGGGILAGAGVGEAPGRMANFRSAMNTQPFNALGMNYEKNLKMMQDIVSSGMNVSSVATGKTNPFEKTTGAGPANDFYSSVTRGMYIGGATLGMDPTAAVQTTIKLLQTYRQTFQQSEGFFMRLEKETKAAGLSTMKYIDIVDGITGQFDRFNRGLEDVVGTMAVLGRTGTATAEDLKEGAAALTNTKREASTRAFLSQQMTPQELNQNIASLGDKISSAQDDMVATLKDQPDLQDINKLYLSNPNNAADFQRRLAQSNMSAETRMGLGSSYTQMQANQQKLATYKQFQQSGGRGVPLALQQNVLGQGPQEGINQFVQGVSYLNKQVGGGLLGKLSDPQEMARIAGTAAAQQANQVFGVNLRTILETSQRGAGGFMTNVMKGPNGEAPGITDQNFIGEQAKLISKAMGIDTHNKSNEQVASEFLNMLNDPNTGKKAQQTASQAFQQNGTFFENMLTDQRFKKVMQTPEEAAQERARRQQVAGDAQIAAKPSAEIFADAFSYLFQLLAKPLNAIQGYMEKFWNMWSKDGDEINGAEAQAHMTQLSALMPDAYTGYSDQIKTKQKELDDLKAQGKEDSADYKSKSAELDKLKATQAGLGDTNLPGTWAAMLQKESDVFSGIGYMADPAARQRSQMDELKKIGGNSVAGATDQLQFGQYDYQKQMYMLQALESAGMIKVGQADDKGTVIVTVNHNTEQLRAPLNVQGVNRSYEDMSPTEAYAKAKGAAQPGWGSK